MSEFDRYLSTAVGIVAVVVCVFVCVCGWVFFYCFVSCSQQRIWTEVPLAGTNTTSVMKKKID